MFERDFHDLSVEAAKYDLMIFLKMSKKEKRKVVSLIVGYGSSGKTHKIKTAFLEELEKLKFKGYIKDYISGENVNLFNLKYLNFKYRDYLDDNVKRRPNKGTIYVIL